MSDYFKYNVIFFLQPKMTATLVDSMLERLMQIGSQGYSLTGWAYKIDSYCTKHQQLWNQLSRTVGLSRLTFSR